MIKTFGLTGNIGCGKTIVAGFLSKHEDVVTFDCDNIAKEIVCSEANEKNIVGIFGNKILSDEKIDLVAIGKIIFADKEKKKCFEDLIHPLVWKTIQTDMLNIKAERICVVESAILFEIGWEKRFSGMIVAVCNPTEQMRRLRDVRKIKEADIKARLAQQLPSSEKEARAQFVIRTDCSLKKLKDRVSDLYQKLKKQTIERSI